MTSLTTHICFGESLSEFSFSLYQELDKRDNTCLSPFGISATLLLLMMGTNGVSRSQIQNALFKNRYPDGEINEEYRQLDDTLTSKTSNSSGMHLSIANYLFIEKTAVHRVKYGFRRQARQNYKCDVGLVDFSLEPYTRDIINQWIEQRTGHKIKNFIPEGLLNDYTFMVLTNVIYFKGLWESKFDVKQTRERDFWIHKNKTTSVSMMYHKLKVKAAEDKELNCKAVELRYKGDNLSMVVILPNEVDGLSSLEQNLTFAEFSRLTMKMYERETEVVLPKFKIKARFDLQPVLNNMGVTEIFNPAKADFSHMIQPDSQHGEQFVSNAIHESDIEVSEEGSEATAATSFVISFRSAMPPAFKFTADHPFLFVIRDLINGTILFIGRYAVPNVNETGQFTFPLKQYENLSPETFKLEPLENFSKIASPDIQNFKPQNFTIQRNFTDSILSQYLTMSEKNPSNISSHLITNSPLVVDMNNSRDNKTSNLSHTSDNFTSEVPVVYSDVLMKRETQGNSKPASITEDVVNNVTTAYERPVVVSSGELGNTVSQNNVKPRLFPEALQQNITQETGNTSGWFQTSNRFK